MSAYPVLPARPQPHAPAPAYEPIADQQPTGALNTRSVEVVKSSDLETTGKMSRKQQKEENRNKLIKYALIAAVVIIAAVLLVVLAKAWLAAAATYGSASIGGSLYVHASAGKMATAYPRWYW
jgi:hypothetical protein